MTAMNLIMAACIDAEPKVPPNRGNRHTETREKSLKGEVFYGHAKTIGLECGGMTPL